LVYFGHIAWKNSLHERTAARKMAQSLHVNRVIDVFTARVKLNKPVGRSYRVVVFILFVVGIGYIELCLLREIAKREAGTQGLECADGSQKITLIQCSFGHVVQLLGRAGLW